MCRFT